MTWSFSDSATPSAKDQVRILVGDTDSSDPLVSDESINLYLSGGTLAKSSVHLAAAAVADDIAAKFARRADSLSAGGTSVNWAGLVTRYTALAARLRAKDGVAIFAGGISQSAKDTQTDNTDNTMPSFTRDSWPYENPLTGEERSYRGV